uniref:Arsenite methyltransferase n=1 Tax=Callorhinchus milii TaxID=7868 RepID=V9L122_CALMI
MKAAESGSAIRERVQSYYGKRLKQSGDLQTNVTCPKSLPLSKLAREALELIHPEVSRRYFGCGLVIPSNLEGCRILDLGSGSGRDCYALSKLVGPSGHVTGVDMTDELIQVARSYISYHQEKFGFKDSNTEFVQGYIEKLGEAGIPYGAFDILISNCVICLCADKKAVFQEAYRVLKEGGEMYFSDMYASQPVAEELRHDPVLWGEGLGGSLYWKDLISMVKELGFSTPHLVTASHIVIYNPEHLKQTGDVQYASGTYRFFKLPTARNDQKALVTYKGTITDFPEQLLFDAIHTFKKDEAVAVDGELATVLKSSRFASHFDVHSAEHEESTEDNPQQQTLCHLNPFLLADTLGSSIPKACKTPKDGACETQTDQPCRGDMAKGCCN